MANLVCVSALFRPSADTSRASIPAKLLVGTYTVPLGRRLIDSGTYLHVPYLYFHDGIPFCFILIFEN